MSDANITEREAELRIEAYFKLLLSFRALPEMKSKRTFMEVAGYPHYENVCSNILGFFFDPSAEHGLKDLLMISFLHMAGAGEIRIPEKVSLEREYPAEDQKRIDLVIQSEFFTLGIENKIYHWDANDFENYARVIDQLGKNRKTIKAVLCLNKSRNQNPLKGGFVRYTYGELWQQVRTRLGNFISQAEPKWLTCLIDFMETTTNLAGQNMELKKTDRFFIEHGEDIERLIAERDAFLARLQAKVLQMTTLVMDADEVKYLSKPPWIYKKSCLVFDFNFKDLYAIAFDLYLGPTGWELQLFGRNANSTAYLGKLINQEPLKALVFGATIAANRHNVKSWGVETDLGEISDALCRWMRALIDANAAEAS